MTNIRRAKGGDLSYLETMKELELERKMANKARQISAKELELKQKDSNNAMPQKTPSKQSHAPAFASPPASPPVDDDSQFTMVYERLPSFLPQYPTDQLNGPAEGLAAGKEGKLLASPSRKTSDTTPRMSSAELDAFVDADGDGIDDNTNLTREDHEAELQRLREQMRQMQEQMQRMREEVASERQAKEKAMLERKSRWNLAKAYFSGSDQTGEDDVREDGREAYEERKRKKAAAKKGVLRQFLANLSQSGSAEGSAARVNYYEVNLDCFAQLKEPKEKAGSTLDIVRGKSQTYDLRFTLPLRLLENGNFRMYNEQFIHRDVRKKQGTEYQREQWCLALLKVLAMYIAACGLTQLSSNRSGIVALRILSIPVALVNFSKWIRNLYTKIQTVISVQTLALRLARELRESGLRKTPASGQDTQTKLWAKNGLRKQAKQAVADPKTFATGKSATAKAIANSLMKKIKSIKNGGLKPALKRMRRTAMKHAKQICPWLRNSDDKQAAEDARLKFFEKCLLRPDHQSSHLLEKWCARAASFSTLIKDCSSTKGLPFLRFENVIELFVCPTQPPDLDQLKLALAELVDIDLYSIAAKTNEVAEVRDFIGKWIDRLQKELGVQFKTKHKLKEERAEAKAKALKEKRERAAMLRMNLTTISPRMRLEAARKSLHGDHALVRILRSHEQAMKFAQVDNTKAQRRPRITLPAKPLRVTIKRMHAAEVAANANSSDDQGQQGTHGRLTFSRGSSRQGQQDRVNFSRGSSRQGVSREDRDLERDGETKSEETKSEDDKQRDMWKRIYPHAHEGMIDLVLMLSKQTEFKRTDQVDGVQDVTDQAQTC